MKFQISAPIIWGYQFSIDDEILLSVPKDELEKFISAQAKDHLKAFFYSNNLLDIVDVINKIKHFCVSGRLHDNLLSGETSEIVYLCYHENSLHSCC